MIKLIDSDGLREIYGITYHPVHRLRLMNDGKFPRAVKLGGKKEHWVASEIDEYIAQLKADRNKVA